MCGCVLLSVLQKPSCVCIFYSPPSLPPSHRSSSFIPASQLGSLPSSPSTSSSPTPTSSPTHTPMPSTRPPLPPIPDSPSPEPRPSDHARVSEVEGFGEDASIPSCRQSIVSLTDIDLQVREEGAGVAPPLSNGVLPSATSRSAVDLSVTKSGELRSSGAAMLDTDGVGTTTAGSSKPLFRRATEPTLFPGMKKSRSQESLDALKEEEEEEDTLGEMEGVGSKESAIRKRTVTISAGGKYRKNELGLGRKSPRQVKQEANRLTRRKSAEFPRGSMSRIKRSELFSPDVEEKIRAKICFHIGQKYGGLERATQAAVAIQRAYRQFKMKRRFDEIRREASQMRKRAQTMGQGRSRRQSIIGMQRPRYRREISTPLARDPLAIAREKAARLRKERSGHVLGQADLVQKARTKGGMDVEAEAGQTLLVAKPLQNGSPSISSGPPFHSGLKLTISSASREESSADSPPREDTNGRTSATLPSSFSSDQLLTRDGYGRPLSIFSVRSAISLQELKEDEAGQDVRSPRRRNHTQETMQKKMSIGINFFNRWVLSYLGLETCHSCLYSVVVLSWYPTI